MTADTVMAPNGPAVETGHRLTQSLVGQLALPLGSRPAICMETGSWNPRSPV